MNIDISTFLNSAKTSGAGLFSAILKFHVNVTIA